MYMWLLLLAADAGAVAIAIQALRAKDRDALVGLTRWARACAWSAFAGVLLVAGVTAARALSSYRAVVDSVPASLHASVRQLVIAESTSRSTCALGAASASRRESPARAAGLPSKGRRCDATAAFGTRHR